jgi:hypothetical protein
VNERAARFEAYLAQLYTDAAERERFLRDPRAAARAAGLDAAACAALAEIDRTGLELASRSFAHKRAGGAGGNQPPHRNQGDGVAGEVRKLALRWRARRPLW